MKLEFSRQISKKKKLQISSFIKIRQLGAELFHADGQTWRRQLSLYLFAENREAMFHLKTTFTEIWFKDF